MKKAINFAQAIETHGRSSGPYMVICLNSIMGAVGIGQYAYSEAYSENFAIVLGEMLELGYDFLALHTRPGRYETSSAEHFATFREIPKPSSRTKKTA